MKQVTITTLTGAEPFTIFLCNSTFTSCMYIDTIYNIDIPYSFLITAPNYSTLSEVGVKAIDSNGCEIKDTVIT